MRAAFVAEVLHEKVVPIKLTIIMLDAGIGAVVKHMVVPAGPGGVVGNAAGQPKQIGRIIAFIDLIGGYKLTRLRIKQLRTIGEAGQIVHAEIVHIDAAVVADVLTLGGQKSDLLDRHHVDGVIGAGLAEGVDAVSGIKPRRRIGLKTEGVGYAGFGTAFGLRAARSHSRDRQHGQHHHKNQCHTQQPLCLLLHNLFSPFGK